MKLKLFKKYFFTTAMVIVFSLTVLMMILAMVLNNYIAGTKKDSLELVSTEMADYITEMSQNAQTLSQKEFNGISAALSKVGSADIFVADTNGKIIYCSCEEWQEKGSCIHSAGTVPKKDITRFTDKEDHFALGTLGIYEKPCYVSAAPLKNSSGETAALVFAAAPTSTVKNLLITITKLYLISSLIPLIFMFFAVYAMTYRLTKPLKLMSEASKAMAKGDFSKRIPVMSDDEIGELSASFNMMTNSLSQLEGMRKSFVANVSHELKTPMTTIGGFIDGILDGTIEPDRQNYYLEIVSQEVKRLSRLVQSMLSMAKLESGEFVLKPELFDFRELICSVVISQEQRIEKQKLEIVGLDAMESISVNADRDLIHQVIYNLVDNAIKFTDPDGRISFALKKENRRLVFTISNTGHGISEKDLPLIFERFYKGDKSRSAAKNSTGLGLYISKTIITAHLGTISVTSKEGESATFTVTLPTA